MPTADSHTVPSALRDARAAATGTPPSRCPPPRTRAGGGCSPPRPPPARASPRAHRRRARRDHLRGDVAARPRRRPRPPVGRLPRLARRGPGARGRSCLACVVAFRGVFCRRLPWGLSYEIAIAAQGTNVLLPSGGAGGLAVAAWALKRTGMPAERIGRRTVAFYVLTSGVNFATASVAGGLLALGILAGGSSLGLTAGSRGRRGARDRHRRRAAADARVAGGLEAPRRARRARPRRDARRAGRRHPRRRPAAAHRQPADHRRRDRLHGVRRRRARRRLRRDRLACRRSARCCWPTSSASSAG